MIPDHPATDGESDGPDDATASPPHSEGDARYPYVICDVPLADAEEAGALLFELGASGVEERDATTLVRGASQPDTITLVASFADRAAADAAVAELPTEYRSRVHEVVGDAWRDEWKKYFEPFLLCRSVFVSPPWRTCNPPGGERVLILEPGRAFGTGLHETTRLVAEVLADHSGDLNAATVLDVGCGSGILALTAVMLGAARARAVDIDLDAVTVTRENAARNGMTDCIEADDTDASALEHQYPWVVANIEAAPLIAMAQALMARVAPGGRLVLSGILGPQAAQGQWESVRAAYSRFQLDDVRHKGEWLAAVLRA